MERMKKNILKTLMIALILSMSVSETVKQINKYKKRIYGYTLPQNMKTVNSNDLEKTIKLEEIKNGNSSLKEHYLDSFKYQTFNKIDTSYKETMNNLNILEEAMVYCSEYLVHGGENFDLKNYGVRDHWASFKQIHKKRIDDCDASPTTGAAILKGNGFPPYELRLRETKEFEKGIHALFIYKTDQDKYGTISIHESENLYPRYSIDGLIKKINYNSGYNYTEYQIFDLNKLIPNYVNNNKNNKVNLGGLGFEKVNFAKKNVFRKKNLQKGRRNKIIHKKHKSI